MKSIAMLSERMETVGERFERFDRFEMDLETFGWKPLERMAQLKQFVMFAHQLWNFGKRLRLGHINDLPVH